MQQLNSKNYVSVSVKIREFDEPIILDVARGTKLMEYLVSGNTATHVQITLEDGTPLIVKATDIQRVQPIIKHQKLTQADLTRLFSELQ